jgi:hypothetical protein
MSVVDENRGRPETPVRGGDSGLDLGSIIDIAGHGDSLTSACADLVSDNFALMQGAASDDDCGTLFSEYSGYAAPEAGTCSCNHRDLSVEPSHDLDMSFRLHRQSN